MSLNNWKTVMIADSEGTPIKLTEVSNANVSHLILGCISVEANYYTIGVDSNLSMNIPNHDSQSYSLNNISYQKSESITQEQATTNINTLHTQGTKYLASFGGPNSFATNGFIDLWTNSYSYYCVGANYNSITKYTSLQESAQALALDIYNILCPIDQATQTRNKNFDGINLDIQDIGLNLNSVTLSQTTDVIAYLGYLALYLKNIGGSVFIVTFSPNANQFTTVVSALYSTLEANYGNYINFYNIKYYDTTSDYSKSNNMFVSDLTNFCSVNQLITLGIPSKKIVAGLSIEGKQGAVSWPSTKFTNWDDASNNFITNNALSAPDNLKNWFSDNKNTAGGAMVYMGVSQLNGNDDAYIASLGSQIANQKQYYAQTGTQSNTTLLNFFSSINTNITPSNSNVCFPKGTLITTDQGEIAIENINPHYNTINNKKIIGIVESKNLENRLVEIKKDALGPNCPNRTTLISSYHEIFYNGRMIRAKVLIEKNTEGVRFIRTDDKMIYNVLMENHDTMEVNNLIVETLKPTNWHAICFMNKINQKTETERELDNFQNLLNTDVTVC